MNKLRDDEMVLHVNVRVFQMLTIHQLYDAMVLMLYSKMTK